MVATHFSFKGWMNLLILNNFAITSYQQVLDCNFISKYYHQTVQN